MSEQSIHLAFGPVQDFLAQARRTRDLWVGSYLLSYLAAHALDSAQRAGGRVVLPALVTNTLFAAVSNRTQPAPPGDRVGSVPHVAEITAPVSHGAGIARYAVRGWSTTWQRINQVVKEYVRGQFPSWSTETERIWERQVGQLWAPMWVLGDPEAMARRKTLRAFALVAEEGEKCTCCGSREALHAGDGSRARVRAFWSQVAMRIESQDVQPDGAERLCAICITKRFIPYVAVEAFGWKVPTAFPSTVSMATLPWRLEVLKKGAVNAPLRSAVVQHVRTLRNAGVRAVDALTGFPALEVAARAWPIDARSAEAFLAYDGDWFISSEVQSMEHGNLEPAQRSAILESLRTLHRAATAAGIHGPQTSYALLALDGGVNPYDQTNSNAQSGCRQG